MKHPNAAQRVPFLSEQKGGWLRKSCFFLDNDCQHFLISPRDFSIGLRRFVDELSVRIGPDLNEF